MSGSSRPRRLPAAPRGIRWIAAAVAALAVLLGPAAGPAAAHDVLVGSTPAPGAALETPPGDVTLEFSSTPQPLGTEVVVTGPDGTTVSQGRPEVGGRTVVQPLPADLPAGTYTVDWRVVSADGHPLSGTLTFTVAQGAGTGTAPMDTPSAVAGTAGTGPSAAGGSSAALWIAVGAVLAVSAVVISRQLRRPV